MTEPVIPPKRGQKIVEPFEDNPPTLIMAEWMEQVSRLLVSLQDSIDTLTIIQDSGSPEGVVTAGFNKLYRDTGTNTVYIKTTDTGNTGWVAV